MIQNDYYQLTPDTVIDAVESLGFLSDARILALNSYENRVYQVGIEASQPLIAKFYRPSRWSDAQIQEDHDFTQALSELEIPVVAPLRFDGQSLHQYEGYRFAVYPRRGGRAPELENYDQLKIIGRFLGRIHTCGQQSLFKYRPMIDHQTFASDSRDYLLTHDFIPAELIPAYETITRDLIERLQKIFSNCNYQPTRLHGDCHVGNILWREGSAHFVDFDDSRNGPAIQDLWMLLSGDAQQRCRQLMEIVEGYQDFRAFEPAELNLIEALRAMRLMHYAAWLARRWKDPAFPMNFPWFNSQRYWSDHVLSLREQLAALDEPVLRWR
ncbi:MAG: Ser/Thr protein kinase RdoA (MazF antagonist) [Cellvibrionaceae bacterium]|jgi:Ser/Thr protein kinase RdoA (MazF antagonist)